MRISTKRITQGQRMTRSRNFMGITQEEMAQLLGKSKNTISNWENDHVDPPLSSMAKWARLTGRTIDWIAFGDEPEESDGENKKTPTANGGGLAARPKGFEPLTF